MLEGIDINTGEHVVITDAFFFKCLTDRTGFAFDFDTQYVQKEMI